MLWRIRTFIFLALPTAHLVRQPKFSNNMYMLRLDLKRDLTQNLTDHTY